jgi:hypothetical protein
MFFMVDPGAVGNRSVPCEFFTLVPGRLAQPIDSIFNKQTTLQLKLSEMPEQCSLTVNHRPGGNIGESCCRLIVFPSLLW